MPKIINLFNTQGKGKRVKQRHSHTSVRLNLTVEPQELESFKRLQEFLRMFTGGSRVSASIVIRRLLNLYTARLADIVVGVSQRIETGELKESDRADAIAEAMKPEIVALMRAGNLKVKV